MTNIFNTKILQFFEIGDEFDKKKMNLSRKKFIASFIEGMCISRSVQFGEIAFFFNEKVKEESNMRRIQSFFADYELNYTQLAILLISFIPHTKYRICIDRTNWMFGNKDINVLALTIYYKGTSIPIIFEMLDKKGNSNQEERIDLLSRFIDIFGHKCIRSVVADREFIGQKWLSFLIENKIKFHLRIPKSHYIEFRNEIKRGDELLSIHGKCFLKNIKIKGFILNLAMDFSKNKNGEDDPLLVLTNTKNEETLSVYKERWSIEVFFQSLKKRGFNLEDTHLKDTDRIAKLFALTNIAFVICLTIGGYADACEKEIPIKNHGYKANSYFRHGLNIVRSLLIKPILMKERLEDLSDFVLNFAKSIFEYSTKKMVKIKSEKIIM